MDKIEVITLLKQTSPELFKKYNLEFKKKFGEITVYINGKIFMSRGKFSVALKLPEKIINELFKDNQAKHLKYFPKGHIKKNYAVLSSKILKNKKVFKSLLNKSITNVL